MVEIGNLNHMPPMHNICASYNIYRTQSAHMYYCIRTSFQLHSFITLFMYFHCTLLFLPDSILFYIYSIIIRSEIYVSVCSL